VSRPRRTVVSGQFPAAVTNRGRIGLPAGVGVDLPALSGPGIDPVCIHYRATSRPLDSSLDPHPRRTMTLQIPDNSDLGRREQHAPATAQRGRPPQHHSDQDNPSRPELLRGRPSDTASGAPDDPRSPSRRRRLNQANRPTGHDNETRDNRQAEPPPRSEFEHAYTHTTAQQPNCHRPDPPLPLESAKRQQCWSGLVWQRGR
jgi:hypothetical protein